MQNPPLPRSLPAKNLIFWLMHFCCIVVKYQQFKLKISNFLMLPLPSPLQNSFFLTIVKSVVKLRAQDELEMQLQNHSVCLCFAHYIDWGTGFRLLRQWAYADDTTFLYLLLLNKSFEYQRGSLQRGEKIRRLTDSTTVLKCRWYCKVRAPYVNGNFANMHSSLQ
jgi:hypothetical protein